MASRLIYSIQISVHQPEQGEGFEEIFTAQAVAANGEKLAYHAEALTISKALQAVAETIAQEESREKSKE